MRFSLLAVVALAALAATTVSAQAPIPYRMDGPSLRLRALRRNRRAVTSELLQPTHGSCTVVLFLNRCSGWQIGAPLGTAPIVVRAQWGRTRENGNRGLTASRTMHLGGFRNTHWICLFLSLSLYALFARSSSACLCSALRPQLDMFLDLLCPDCAAAWPNIKQVRFCKRGEKREALHACGSARGVLRVWRVSAVASN